MGPFKIAGLLVSFLTFLWGMALSDDPWLIFIGILAFIACCFAPNDI